MIYYKAMEEAKGEGLFRFGYLDVQVTGEEGDNLEIAGIRRQEILVWSKAITPFGELHSMSLNYD